MKTCINASWASTAIVAGLILDQASKSAAHQWVASHGPLSVLPVLDVTAGFNTGVAFGLATRAGQPILVIVAAVIVAWLAVLVVKADSRIEALGAGAIIGGALGNVVDRVRFGGVRDFIDVHVGGWHWPTFNLADTLIFIGVVLLIVPGVFPRTRWRAAPRSPASPSKGTGHV